jgi:hypothetical protein
MYGVQNYFSSNPSSQKMIYREIQRNNSLLKTNFSNLVTTLGPMRGEKKKPTHKVMYGRLVNGLEHEHAPTPQPPRGGSFKEIKLSLLS